MPACRDARSREKWLAMIPATPLPTPDWQAILAEAIRDPRELLRQLGLAQHPALDVDFDPSFPLRAPAPWVARMQHGNPNDPLLLQTLPLRRELDEVVGFSADPVGDLEAARGHGLLQKYHGRALLLTTAACAIHCRYCFRRAFPYQDYSLSPQALQDLQTELNADPSLHELILSGGDPLALSTPRLRKLIETLRTVPHLQTLRIHTRLPVVIPQRIDTELLQLLEQASQRWRVVIVLHVNHAQEIDEVFAGAIHALRQLPVTLLNQTVLLRGINDKVEQLLELSHALHQLYILPYYLHQLDHVTGAAHFSVPDAAAQALHSALLSQLPGYLVPRLVREISGAANKMPL
jgi:EF-P beta-lysylation protein EpmB